MDIRRASAMVALVGGIFVLAAATVMAVEPRVLPAGQQPADRRLGPLTDLNGYFPMQVPESLEAWEERAAKLRQRLKVALGLWPMPTKTPLEAVVHGRIEGDGYTIERVFFQSFPGHYVSGSLFRPTAESEGPRPAVLCPHGHWSNGRFYDAGEQNIRWQVVRGEERFLDGGRNPILSRCVQMARMGCVVFAYDMEGYADSQQLPHRRGEHEIANTPEKWNYFSAQAEMRLQHKLGLQTWNSIRALDFVCSLDDVDQSRIAVTGASGGGTQTFILCAVDPRPAVAAPAVMVSTAMQGGCTCENCCYLRVDAGNIELAALFAPKPMHLIAADDWTVELATKGLPELKALYQMYEKPNHLSAAVLTQFKHNYNYVSRATTYLFLNKHLKLGLPEPIVEGAYDRPSREQLTVWNDEHQPPAGGPEYEQKMLAAMAADSDAKVGEHLPKEGDAESADRFRTLMEPVLGTIVGRDLLPPEAVTFAVVADEEVPGGRFQKGLLRVSQHQEELPTLIFRPGESRDVAVVWAHARGKAALINAESGQPVPEVTNLLKQGVTVIGIDLFQQGEFLKEDGPLTKTRLVENPWNHAGHTFGYNRPLLALRAHDLMTAISYLQQDAQPTKVTLLGFGEVAPAVALAAAVAGPKADAVAIHTGGFRFQSVDRLDHPLFVPGIVKYGDLPALIALRAPQKLWLAGEAETPKLISAQYANLTSERNLTTSPDGRIDEALKFLTSGK